MVSLSANANLARLYEVDDYLWLEQTIQLLKDNQLDELDREHLIEELEELGRSEKRSVESLLQQIIRHLLLYHYWTPEHADNARHWQAEIISFRNQLNRRLTATLYRHLEDNLKDIYEDAGDYVRVKSQVTILPEVCPYSLVQLLDKHWLPEVSDVSSV